MYLYNVFGAFADLFGKSVLRYDFLERWEGDKCKYNNCVCVAGCCNYRLSVRCCSMASAFNNKWTQMKCASPALFDDYNIVSSRGNNGKSLSLTVSCAHTIFIHMMVSYTPLQIACILCIMRITTYTYKHNIMPTFLLVFRPSRPSCRHHSLVSHTIILHGTYNILYTYKYDDDVRIHTAHINLTNGPVHPRPPELVSSSIAYIILCIHIITP